MTPMTKLLDQALEAVRLLPPANQNEIARVIMRLLGGPARPVALSPDEREALACSKAAAARGEFVTDGQIRAVWPSTAYEAALYPSGAGRSRFQIAGLSAAS
jgi:hypothetical protein